MSGTGGTAAGLLAGRTVLVTGADGTGVGRGVAEAVHAADARLVLHGLTRESAADAADSLPGSVPVHGDLTDESAVRRFFADAEQAVGPLDGLVNNAGVGHNGPAVEASVSEFDRLYDVDVRGTWLCVRAFVGARHGTGPAAIVNVSSVHATATMAGYALYAGAKAAVDGLTRGLAVELGPLGVRCNAIAPGYVHSEQNLALLGGLTRDPVGWVEQHTRDQQAVPQLVDRASCGAVAAFLLSSAATGVTGQVVAIDNGTTSLLYNRSFTDLRGRA